MKKLVAFLLSLFSVAACTESIKPNRQRAAQGAEVWATILNATLYGAYAVNY